LEIVFIKYVISSDALQYSQVGQDLLCHFFIQENETGIFVEVSVRDGELFSNTKMLEEKSWDGILIEPNKQFHRQIKKNRCASLIKKAAGDSKSSLRFYETKIGELSYTETEPNDGLSRDIRRSYNVDVETLDEILSSAEIKSLDFLSIDVEGHELEVLKGLTLSNFNPRVCTIETNGDNEKKEIIEKSFGEKYRVVFEKISYPDIWIVRKDVFSNKANGITI
jgi:FkbM family methyltransferase